MNIEKRDVDEKIELNRYSSGHEWYGVGLFVVFFYGSVFTV